MVRSMVRVKSVIAILLLICVVSVAAVAAASVTLEFNEKWKAGFRNLDEVTALQDVAEYGNDVYVLLLACYNSSSDFYTCFPVIAKIDKMSGRIVDAVEIFEELNYVPDPTFAQPREYASMTIYNDTVYVYMSDNLYDIILCNLSVNDLSNVKCFARRSGPSTFSAQTLNVVDDLLVGANKYWGVVTIINLSDMSARILYTSDFSAVLDDAVIVVKRDTSNFDTYVCKLDPVTLSTECVRINDFLAQDIIPLRDKIVVRISDVNEYAVFDKNLNLVKAFKLPSDTIIFDLVDAGDYVLAFCYNYDYSNMSLLVLDRKFNLLASYAIDNIPNIARSYVADDEAADIFTYTNIYPPMYMYVIGNSNINITDVKLDVVPGGTLTYSSASTTLVQVDPVPQQLPSSALAGSYINISLINAVIKIDDGVVLGGSAESLSVTRALAVAAVALASSALLLRRVFQ